MTMVGVILGSLSQGVTLVSMEFVEIIYAFNSIK